MSNPCGAMEARWTSNSKVVGSSPIRGGTLFFFPSFSTFLHILLHIQTEIEIEGGSGGVSVNIPRIAGSVSPSGAEQGYHLCSCGNGRIFLVNSNPLGCFAAVGHNQLGNVCS